MKNIKLFIFLVSFGLISSYTFSEEGEEEAAQPSNPQELLEIVKQGQFADTQEQREREAAFRNEKNKQAKNKTPITNEVIPVLPPAFTPAPDST